ncbi:MAG: PAS domain-containing protein, partial [Candidatus Colwellbacteria bacterium]|nr:PAS domain-containing protein [Candidatus Colwellbacteria bacterium]
MLWVIVASVILLGAAIAVILWLRKRLYKAKLETKTASSRLQTIISDLSDGIIAYDNRFTIQIFNPAAEKIFGLKSETVVSQSFGPERAQELPFRLLTQTIFPSLAPLVVERSEPGVYPQIVDLSFTDPKRELRVSTNRVLGPAGETLGFIKLVKDKTREMELLRSKSEFITIAAHQLRTPLTTMHWVLEGLKGKEKLEAEDKELVASGLSNSVKLLKIVNDLLDVSKIEEGKFGYDFREVNVMEFLSGILTNAETMAKKYEVELYFDKGKETTINTMIDAGRLGLAISNLLDNAIKYNVKNGTVTVKIERLADKPYLQVSIKDTGIGIPPEEVPKLFTKFFRSENAVRIETEGSGLGLYITKNIIERHGGAIWAESILG